MKKVFVLGIDGAFPEYIFGEWLDELPNIKKLKEKGVYAKLNSTIPPLSATAWTSIVTGKSPPDTGIFEYLYRKNNSYDNFHVITSRNIKEKTIWQIASEANKKSAVSYMLVTWPIKPFNGWMISDSLLGHSKDNNDSIHPEELKQEIESFLGEIPPQDVSHFRDLNKEEIIKEVYSLSEKHFKLMRYLIKNKNWDLFFGLSGLSDRMNHSFWKYTDKEHRKYEKDSKFKDTLKDFYKFVDKNLGELIELLDKDTTIIVLSDHGITRMHTRINLTDWLIKEGYMVLKTPLKEKTEFKPELVNWKNTKAFAIGAYEGQIFINKKNREPEGIVNEEEYDYLISELSEKLKQIKGEKEEKLNTKIFNKKQDFQGKYQEIAPDMIIYFDDLQYGCNTTLVGNETLYSEQTARGSDDACHSRQGIFIMVNKGNGNKNKNKNLGEIEAIDVAPTILNQLGIKIPEDMKGKIIK